MISTQLFSCPACSGDVEVEASGFSCSACKTKFPLEKGILRCFAEHQKNENDVTDTVKAFYEKHPFPNYEELESIEELRRKAAKGYFSKTLDDQLPHGINILECGCGTGQLTNFLAAGGRTVYGTDICINSLSLAQDFKELHGIDGAHFLQMNLFKPFFKQKSFDLVICNGVLHHTSNPNNGFRSVASLVKPGGFAMVGLYHNYARLITDFRRFLFRVSRGRLQPRDRQLKTLSGDAKRRGWLFDQYLHPHESKHTLYEVHKWCEQEGLIVVNTFPKTLIGDSIEPDEKIFRQREMPGRLESLLSELTWAFKDTVDNGFFTVIAKKPK